MSNFPLVMENIPRQKSFMCLSLKFGCIFSALIIILYTILALAQSTAVMGKLIGTVSPDNLENVSTYSMVGAVIIVHCVTLFLTALMLVGTLREKHRLMRPWLIWTSVQVTAYVLMFVFWTVTNMIGHIPESSVLVMIVEVLSLLVRFYMLVLVSSYYEQLEEENNYGERLKTLDNETWYQAA